MMMYYEKLGQQLRLARERAQMTQTEAAQGIEVTPSALNQYESGKRRVDAFTVERLARLYGVPIRHLFEEEIASSEWEEALRWGSETISAASKAGIGRLIERVSNLEELYSLMAIPFPGPPHPPFAPIPDDRLSERQTTIALAQKARSHYNLGTAPLLDLRRFLEERNYHIFLIPFGEEPNALEGLFFIHPNLGAIAALNEDCPEGDRSLKLAHLFAHSLYQRDRPAILCRKNDTSPLETFANCFAAYFLIPSEALADRLQARHLNRVTEPAEVFHLAHYFGVSYQTLLERLHQERCLSGSLEQFQNVESFRLARILGYSQSSHQGIPGFIPLEKRLPRIFIELAYRAVESEELSIGVAAELLGISACELEDSLYFQTPEYEADEPVKILNF